MSSEALEQALLYPKQSVELTCTTRNIMSVNVPVYDFQTKTKSDADIYPYGFAATSGELDDAVEALAETSGYEIASRRHFGDTTLDLLERLCTE